MPNPGLLLVPGNASLAYTDTGAGGTATGSGALRYATGALAGQQAFLVEESTINLVGNPWFAVNAAGWTGATRDTGYSYMGPASGLISATGANAEATYALTVPATAHRLSARVRNNAAASRSFQLRYNGANVGSPLVVAAGAVARLDAAITGTAGSAAAGVRITDSANGETFNVAHLQVEAKNGYVTSECPEINAAGTIQTGYTWAGTAHASASTRAVTTVKVDETGHLNVQQGSMACWFYREVDNGLSQSMIALGDFGTAGKDAIALQVDSSDQFRAQFRTGTSASVNVVRTGSVAVGGWHFGYVEWNGTAVAIRYDAEAPITGTRNAPIGDISTTRDLAIGGDAFYGTLDGRIGPIMVFDRPLTTTERTALFNRTAPWVIGMLGDNALPASGVVGSGAVAASLRATAGLRGGVVGVGQVAAPRLGEVQPLAGGVVGAGLVSEGHLGLSYGLTGHVLGGGVVAGGRLGVNHPLAGGVIGGGSIAVAATLRRSYRAGARPAPVFSAGRPEPPV